jgi:hypothetical protein
MGQYKMRPAEPLAVQTPVQKKATLRVTTNQEVIHRGTSLRVGQKYRHVSDVSIQYFYLYGRYS